MGDTEALMQDAAVLEQTLLRAAELPDIGQRVASELFFVGRWLHAGGAIDSALHLWHLVAGWHDVRTRPLWRIQATTLPAFVALAEGRIGDAEQAFSAALQGHGRQLELQGQWTELRLRCGALRLRLGRSALDVASILLPVFDSNSTPGPLKP